MNFFLEKQLIKLSCTYQPLLFCKILTKFLGRIQSSEDVSFSGQKWPICQEQNIFVINLYYYFHLPIGPFHRAKKFLQQIQSYEDASFSGPKWFICLKQFFFEKNYKYHFYLPIGPFHSTKFQKNAQSQSRVMKMCHFRAQNTPISPEQNFLVQTIIITFIYLLAFSIGQNF